MGFSWFSNQEELEDEDAELEPWEDSEVFEDRVIFLWRHFLGGEEAVEIDHPNIFQYIMDIYIYRKYMYIHIYILYIYIYIIHTVI